MVATDNQRRVFVRALVALPEGQVGILYETDKYLGTLISKGL